MSFAEEPTLYMDGFAADAQLNDRLSFIRRTYLHVFAGVMAFIGLETLYFTTPIADNLALAIGQNWWMAFIGFMIVTFLAQRWAMSGASPQVQYMGLGLYVFAESIIFIPLLYVAQQFGSDIIPTAAFLTMVVFGGLTFLVFVTKQDFSFLRNFLWIASLAVLGIIVVSAFTGGSLGIVFVGGVILLMCGYILYDTSNVLHHYRTDQHVAAALALFGSLATLFWYMIQFVMMFAGDD